MDINIHHNLTITIGLNHEAKAWIMATIADLTAKVSEVGMKVDAAAARALSSSQALNATVADLKAQLEAAGAPPEVMASLQKIEDVADQIDPTTPSVVVPGATA